MECFKVIYWEIITAMRFINKNPDCVRILGFFSTFTSINTIQQHIIQSLWWMVTSYAVTANQNPLHIYLLSLNAFIFHHKWLIEHFHIHYSIIFPFIYYKDFLNSYSAIVATVHYKHSTISLCQYISHLLAKSYEGLIKVLY